MGATWAKLVVLGRFRQVAERAALVVAEIVAGALALMVVAVLVLAVRLSIGPIDLSFLLPRIEAALTAGAGGTHVVVGSVTLDWPGWRHGPEYPLLFTFHNVALRSEAGAARATIPEAKVAVSPLALLDGRIALLRIRLERPQVVAARTRGGEFALALGGPSTRVAPDIATAHVVEQALELLSAPRGREGPSTGFADLRELRALDVEDAAITVIDPTLGTTWVAPQVTLALTRADDGGLRGSAFISLEVGHTRVRFSSLLALSGNELQVDAHLTRIDAQELADAIPALPLPVMLEAPVSFDARLSFGPSFSLERASLDAKIGAGDVVLGDGSVPIHDAVLAIETTGADVTLRSGTVHLASTDNASGPTMSATGAAVREPDGAWRGALSIALDRMPMADLARYWPPGIAAGGRAWVTENITGGVADGGAVTIAFTCPPHSDAVALTRISGGIGGSDLTVHWLRPLPPLTGGEARLSIDGSDALQIHVTRARLGRLTVQGGDVVISGLDQRDQNGAITVRASGPLHDVLALLAAPRLNLLARQKLPVGDASGNVEADLSVAVPLLKNVSMDEILVHAKAKLQSVVLPRILGPYGLEGAELALSVDNDGLHLSGRGSFAGMPTDLTAAMDFRPGPASKVVERVSARAPTDARALGRLGLAGLNRYVEGPIMLDGDVEWRRDGRGVARLRAGLRGAKLQLPVLGVVKAASEPASASVALTLAGSKLIDVERFALNGGGVALVGSAGFAAGRLSRVSIAQAVLGRTEGRGSVYFGAAGTPTRILFTGSTLDLSRYFTGELGHPAEKRPAHAARPAGPGWIAEARFSRVLLAGGKELDGAVMTATNDGRRTTSARVSGAFTPGDTFLLTLEPTDAGRTLKMSTNGTGDLLAALGVTSAIDGGTLTLSGRYDDAEDGSPLTGRAEMDDFRIRNAPVAVRVLEAMSLYGLVRAVRGPGLGVSKLVTHFRFTGGVLALSDARAFNPSLGATAQGTVDLTRGTAALSGTIVPAYFFNSLLGRIPLIGRIFSPEKGGGLIAATYHVNGPLSDPRVSVDPLASLAPGFLRGFFSLFGG